MSYTLLFVVNVDWFFLSHRLPIALQAQREGYRVHIATGLTDRLPDLQRHGLVVHPLALDRGSTRLGNAWQTAVQIWHVYRMVRPDVVHLVTIKPVLLGGFLARLLNVPAVVAAVSGLGYVFMARGLSATIRRLVVRLLYRISLGHRNLKVIFQNPDDRKNLEVVRKFADSSVAMIAGSGVDLTEYKVRPMAPGTPVAMLVARLLADKGVYEFIQGARLLRQRGLPVRCVLVGGIDPANPTSFSQEQVKAWVQEGAVEWWGHRSDISTVMTMAHLIVLPSYREGFPKVLMEAAACGRAVITTDVPGCRDAIRDGVTGVLVPARDAPALADAIATLIASPAAYAAMGAAGRALAEKEFDVRNVVTSHLRIYRELIEAS